MTEAWPPTRYTKPLSEDFPNLWDGYTDANGKKRKGYGKIIQLLWKTAKGWVFEDWQVQLLRHQTEIYPVGHPDQGTLRFRGTLTSVGAQNGKTDLETALVFIFMLWSKRANIRSAGATREHAYVLYENANEIVGKNPEFAALFKRQTDSRGLRRLTGAFYQVITASPKALNALALQLAVADEVHLLGKNIWGLMITRLGARENSMISGITTAGNSESVLLLELYKAGATAIAMPPEANRFGFYVWEAPQARWPDDEETQWEYLLAGNPAYASGRVKRSDAMADVLAMEVADRIRYKLNCFTDAHTSLISLSDWLGLAMPNGYEYPEGSEVIGIGVDDFQNATAASAIKTDDGVIHTRIAKTWLNPKIDELEEWCVALAANRDVATFVINFSQWRELAYRLKRNGYDVLDTNEYDTAKTFMAKVRQQLVVHADDILLRLQIPTTVRHDHGNRWRIDRNASAGSIDSVEATAYAVHGAENWVVLPDQIFF